MDADFWHGVWERNELGFDQQQPNGFLTEHAALFREAERVFVPLAGRSVDCEFLASLGVAVEAVELSPIAVGQFFERVGLAPEKVEVRPGLARWKAGPYTFWVGDIFDLTKEDLEKPLRYLYDRAALVALPPEMRQRYVAHLRGLLEPAVQALAIAFTYPQEAMEGPPFSVPETEVRALWEGFEIERVAQRQIGEGRLAEAGEAYVNAYRIRP